MFRTSNPALSRNPVFGESQTWDNLGASAVDGGEAGTPAKVARPRHMTLQGTVNKTFFLLALCVATAVVGWNGFTSDAAWAPFAMFGGAIGGFIIAMVTIFKPTWSVVTAPMYSLAQGFFVGGISGWYAERFATPDGQLNSGLIINAVLLTFGITGGLLLGYSTKVIRPGRAFYNATIACTFGLVLYGLIAMVLAMFGSFSLASVYDPTNGGLISIGFSAFVVLLASANLVLDFDLINNGVKSRAPRYMEWYGGFALMVTLVWLYLEVLRLLAKLQSRD